MTKRSPFKYFNTSPEIIRLTVMLHWFAVGLVLTLFSTAFVMGIVFLGGFALELFQAEKDL